MEIFLGWIVFSVLAAWIASQKGRSGVGVFFLSLLLSPLIGGIVALVMRPKIDGDRPITETHTRCPACKELVRKDASKCKSCSEPLAPQPIDAPSAGLFTVRCPECNKSNMTYASKCSYCRAILSS